MGRGFPFVLTELFLLLFKIKKDQIISPNYFIRLKEEKKIQLSAVHKSIIKALLYYDIFNYPLTKEEIFYNSCVNTLSREEFYKQIDFLNENGLVHFNDPFYQIEKNPDLIARRKKGNQLAREKLKTAIRVSNFIGYFPFIRAVYLSGSISKGFMEEKSDIDYFVITEPNRLWVARFLLVFFRRVFLFNSHKNFCINYFIDSKSLEIEEKNIYTATELATLIPVYDINLYQKFNDSNNWVYSFLPNIQLAHLQKNNSNHFLKKIFEFVLNNRIGDELDDFFLSLFRRYDQKKFKGYQDQDFEIAFKSRKNVSKHHPNFFQRRVLEAMNKKVEEFENKFKISLTIA